MSGHSKWSTIKRKKGVADAKRGKIFTRCIHEISVAVKEGGGPDPSGNPRLRFAIDKAKSLSMPKDNIDRAVRRAAGLEKGEQQQEIIYEGYGPGGVAVLVEVITDNKNRTVGEVRNIFSKCGGALGENGCVSWMFHKRGLFLIKHETIAEERLMEMALDAGAQDVSDAGDMWEVVCDTPEFTKLKSVFDNAKIDCELAEIQQLPENRVSVEGKEAEQITRMVEMLDELDEVMNVAVNCDVKE